MGDYVKSEWIYLQKKHGKSLELTVKKVVSIIEDSLKNNLDASKCVDEYLLKNGEMEKRLLEQSESALNGWFSTTNSRRISGGDYVEPPDGFKDYINFSIGLVSVEQESAMQNWARIGIKLALMYRLDNLPKYEIVNGSKFKAKDVRRAKYVDNIKHAWDSQQAFKRSPVKLTDKSVVAIHRLIACHEINFSMLSEFTKLEERVELSLNRFHATSSGGYDCISNAVKNGRSCLNRL